MGAGRAQWRASSGLSLVGWLFVGSPSANDAQLLAQVAADALTHREAGTLTAKLAHNLAQSAYEILWPYVGGSEYRAAVVSDHYSRSSRLAPYIPLIDEATLAYYRGYWTVALRPFRPRRSPSPGLGRAGSLAVHLLRSSPFSRAYSKFPASAHRTRAQFLLGGIYSYYDSLDPPPISPNSARPPSWSTGPSRSGSCQLRSTVCAARRACICRTRERILWLCQFPDSRREVANLWCLRSPWS